MCIAFCNYNIIVCFAVVAIIFADVIAQRASMGLFLLQKVLHNYQIYIILTDFTHLFFHRFHFTEYQFKHNMAFYSQIVLPDSQINIICPNIATVLTNLTQYPLRESLYENLWMVGKEEFYSCQINSSKSDNHLLLMCNKPDSLHYYTVNFIRPNTSVSSLHTVKDGNIYFLGECWIFSFKKHFSCLIVW